MWAYKSYNENAPAESEPRFPAPFDNQKTRKSTFSWSSFYTRGKKRNDLGKSPEMDIGSFLHRSKSSIKPRSRRTSFTSSIFSRRSGYDDRLDKIIDMLQLLAKDKGRQESRRDSDCKDNSSGEDSSISDRQGRQSLRSRESDSKTSRRRILPHAAHDGPEAAIQDRKLPSQGPQDDMKKRFNSCVKSGVRQAAKSGLKQVKESMLGRIPEDATDMVARSQSQLERNSIAELYQKGLSKRSRRSKPRMGESRDRHNRFYQEVLGRQDDSPKLNENLLEGLLPPRNGYNLSKPLGSPIEFLDGNQNRKGVLNLPKRRSLKKPNSADRPLHSDPSLSSIQAFAWPDAQEIAERVKTETHDKDGHAVNRVLSSKSSGMTRSTTRPTRPSPTSSNLLYESTDVSVPVPKRDGSPVPWATITRARASDTSGEDFDIVWPSTPTHEPLDIASENEEDLPKYVSPTTEAFDNRKPCGRNLSSTSQAVTPEPMTADSATNGLLFERIISTMSTCLGKLGVSVPPSQD